MILICSFTWVLEAAGGPSAGEDKEGVPLDLADILWGQTRQVSTGGRGEAAARPRPWRCCGRCRPDPSTSWTLPGQPRVAALRAPLGGRTVVLPSTPRDAALGTGLQTRKQRACASSRRRPPLAHRRSRSRPRRGFPGAVPRAGSCSSRGTSPGISSTAPGRQGAGRQVPVLPTPSSRSWNAIICSLLYVFSHLLQFKFLLLHRKQRPESPPRFLINSERTTVGSGVRFKVRKATLNIYPGPKYLQKVSNYSPSDYELNRGALTSAENKRCASIATPSHRGVMESSSVLKRGCLILPIPQSY